MVFHWLSTGPALIQDRGTELCLSIQHLECTYSMERFWYPVFFFSKGLVQFRFSCSFSGEARRAADLRSVSSGTLTCWRNILRNSFQPGHRVPGQHTTLVLMLSSIRNGEQVCYKPWTVISLHSTTCCSCYFHANIFRTPTIWNECLSFFFDLIFDLWTCPKSGIFPSFFLPEMSFFFLTSVCFWNFNVIFIVDQQLFFKVAN